MFKLSRYPALSTEMFTSIMEPELPPTDLGVGACNDRHRFNDDGWWGGTAVITGAAGAAPSLHLAVMFNGIFSPAARDQSVRIELSMPEKNRTIIDEVRLRLSLVNLFNYLLHNILCHSHLCLNILN